MVSHKEAEDIGKTVAREMMGPVIEGTAKEARKDLHEATGYDFSTYEGRMEFRRDFEGLKAEAKKFSRRMRITVFFSAVTAVVVAIVLFVVTGVVVDFCTLVDLKSCPVVGGAPYG